MHFLPHFQAEIACAFTFGALAGGTLNLEPSGCFFPVTV